MKVTVYLGANMGDNPSFKEATIALGRWIAKNGLILVYGGSKMGLMGVLGDTVWNMEVRLMVSCHSFSKIGKLLMRD